MKNNQESELDFQVQMFDAQLKMNLVNNCVADIAQKLDADEVFDNANNKLNFEANLVNKYLSTIANLVVSEIAQRGIESEDYSLVITMLDASSLSDFFERIGTIAGMVPDIMSKIFAQITELYMAQCNKYLVDMDEELLMHSPIFAN